MKTTVEGTELWGLDEVANSELADTETFRITVAMARNLQKQFERMKKDVLHLKLANEFLKTQAKDYNRFISHA